MRHPGDLLSAYVDGSLSAEAAAEVAAHLALCGDCRQVVSDLRATRQLLLKARSPEPPPELLSRLLRGADHAGGAGSRSRAWLPAVAAALVAAAALAVAQLRRPPAAFAPLVAELRDHAHLVARMPLSEPAAASLIAALLEESER